MKEQDITQTEIENRARERTQLRGVDSDYLNEWLLPYQWVPYYRSRNCPVPAGIEAAVRTPRRTYAEYFAKDVYYGKTVLQYSAPSVVETIDAIVQDYNAELAQSGMLFEKSIPYYQRLLDILRPGQTYNYSVSESA